MSHPNFRDDSCFFKEEISPAVKRESTTMHKEVYATDPCKLFSLLLLFFLSNTAFAQPKYFTDSFDKDAGWKLSDLTSPDSARFEIKDGSLILYNLQRNAGMVELKMPFFGDLSHDAEWQLKVRVRHLSGANTYQYGFSQGVKPGTFLNDGLCFGLSGNGYFRADSYFGKTKNEIKGWTKYGPINTDDGAVNEMRIIYRSPWGFYILINDKWAFMGRANGRESNTLTLFAEGQQTVAFDQIDLVSYRGQFTKLADVRAKELKEICTVAVDSFSSARGFPKDDQYKTWLPEIFICNKDYKIFKKTTGVFPERVSKGNPFFVYSITTDFQKVEDRDEQKAKLMSLIKAVLIDYKESKSTTLGDRKAQYFFSKNPDLPKGTVIIIQEYTARRDYEKEDHYYIDFQVLNAPEIKAF